MRLPSPSAHRRVSRSTILLLACGLAFTLAVPATAGASTATIAGEVFADADRDASRSASEPGFGDVLIYLYDGAGTYRGNTRTAQDGRFSLPVDADGTYQVVISTLSWRDHRHDWTPTGTGSLAPAWPVTVRDGRAEVAMGLRRIERSATPVTTLTGPSGVRIESYNDVVTAEELHDALLSGQLPLGPEAAVTTITHDVGTGTSCATGVTRKDGRYVSFNARCNIDWLSWLTGGDRPLFHEYGHAWSLYHAYLTQQDGTFGDYLAVRGLAGDPRLDTSHAWSRRELIAEDYRQLFGSPSARRSTQENRELPAAEEVPGLEAYLATTFATSGTQEPAPPTDPEPAPQPAPGPDPEPDLEPALEVEVLEVTPTPVKGSATVRVAADEASSARITVHDGKGSVVATLATSLVLAPGSVVAVDWDRTGDDGRRVKRGTYTLRVHLRHGDGRQATEAVALPLT